ncbi:MAG: beta-ketoacyl-ACP synthase II, partial [Deltaproteobacteria bacterium]|nr:beta-ketoacyl-ACP synthase II [Deltaproteobacteria bacterium]
MKRRVVITGVGPVTPIGIGKADYWSSLINGKSGAKEIHFEGFDMDQYASKIACPIDDFSLGDLIKKSKDLKYLGRTTQFALAGSKLALEDAGFEVEFVEKGGGQGDYITKGIDPEKTGVILGVGAQCMDLCEKTQNKLLEHKGPRRVSPFALPHTMINAIPVNVSKKFSMKGACLEVSSACASAVHAFIEAYKQILFGDEDMMVTGGAEACITPLVFGGFVSLNAMSRRNDAPEKASRPFDKDRDGFVMGEGAGIIIIEELAHALDRGARIYCEITGYGSTSDAYHIVAPDPGAAMQAKAMGNALRTAGASPEEVDYINAHGTSTPLNDPIETLAIKKAFGNAAYSIPVSSTKSMTGHLIGASGGVELIATALMIHQGKIHPTINLETPGEGC